MEMIEDETNCGPLCQHPSCWSSQRRQTRGFSHTRTCLRSPSPPDNGLPTQTIVNLLAGYEDDPPQSLPLHTPSATQHTRSKVAFHRAQTNESSMFKLKTPNATPASMMRSCTKFSVLSEPSSPRNGKQVGQVEVQEVFDLDDLQSDWHDTFVAKSVLVWVPKSKKKREKPKDPYGDIQIRQMSRAPNTISPKDLTEDMVPKEVTFSRGLNRTSEDFARQYSGEMQKRPAKSPRSPQQGQPSNHQGKKKKEPCYDTYELLDLPQDILEKILEHVPERDLMSREHLAASLLKAMPKLERDNSALSLANSKVLRQKKVTLQDGTGKPCQVEPLPQKQLFLLDGSNDAIDKINSVNHPANSTAPSTTVNIPQETAVISSTAKRIPPTTPIPPIKGKGESAKPRMASVSLGLPTIPSGTKYTRPFNYTRKEIDFTLGPRVTPTPPPSEHLSVTCTGSAPSSDRGSTIHVTMPTIPTDGCGDISGHMDLRRDLTAPNDHLHAMSPSFSTHVPKAPAATPMARHGQSWESPSPTKGEQSTGIQASPMGPNGSQPTALAGALTTPEVSGLLGTIPESEPGAVPVPHTPGYPPTSAIPRSRRSVRFAPEIPPQPPSTPDNATPCVSPDKMTSNQGMENGASGLPPPQINSTAPSPTGMSPEPWPQINEDQFTNSPIPASGSHMGGNMVSNLHDEPSIGGNYDSHSEHSGLTSLLHSRESSRYGKRFPDIDLTGSPAPPPPSPEPKDDSTARSMMGSQIKSVSGEIQEEDEEEEEEEENEHVHNAIDSESDITITASPPSNIDDISRIQTPNVTPMTRETTELSDAENMGDDINGDKSTENVGHNIDGDKIEQKEEINPEDHQPQGETIDGEDHVAPTADKVLIENQSEIVAQSTEQSNPMSVEQNDALRIGIEDENLQEKINQLDQFDATEEIFKEELQEEYEKLSHQGES